MSINVFVKALSTLFEYRSKFWSMAKAHYIFFFRGTPSLDVRICLTFKDLPALNSECTFFKVQLCITVMLDCLKQNMYQNDQDNVQWQKLTLTFRTLTYSI